ncbi:MAG TPA: lysylphosphatidylglycerol synthase transmembrane domain-containing protein [Myxococcota bacterium]|nr:lysylphosphatidylglycerol synthase transmembrane domain-containing protein [Myxococcota bacterium]
MRPSRSTSLGSASLRARFARSRRWRDPRVWLGLAVTAVTLWLALRGIDPKALARDLARADLPLVIGISVPAYLLSIWLRALRWRYLTDAIAPVPHRPLFRATAVGFLANNVFPLRVGELVRAWTLARDQRLGVAPVIGTIVLERVIDGIVVVGMAIAIFGARGTRSGDALAVGLPLLLGALLPLGLVLLMRFAPERAAAVARFTAHRLLPGRVGSSLEELVRRMSEGLGSIQGGRHLWWVALHSALIWGVLGVVPFLAGFAALGIELGSPARALSASYVVLTAVGIAVALPSAPGFFGPYHLAAREALARFGVGEGQALALGTLSHAVFWLTTSAIGLWVLRGRSARLEELADAADSGETDPPSAGA